MLIFFYFVEIIKEILMNENEEFNLDPALCEKFASYLESKEEDLLAAVCQLVSHQAAEQDSPM